MEVYEGGKRPDMPELPKGFVGKTITGIIVAVVILLGLTMFYTVEEQEGAAILTFGQYSHTVTEAGLKMKAPYPIQKVVKVPANLTQQIHIGYRVVNNQQVARDDEALMITGDENIVSADAVVEWRVSNIRDYLYNIEDPENFLRNASIAAIRSIIGSTNLDYAITDGKTVIQGEVKNLLVQLNDNYQTGIQIMDVKFQDIEPPSGEVQQAFKKVTDAREEQNTKVNNANRYSNERLPKARGEAQQLIEQAEAEKQRRILNAQGDVAKFEAVYGEYQKSPQTTQYRLIVETLEKVLPNANIVITNSNSDTVQYLPLNDLLRRGGTQ